MSSLCFCLTYVHRSTSVSAHMFISNHRDRQKGNTSIGAWRQQMMLTSSGLQSYGHAYSFISFHSDFFSFLFLVCLTLKKKAQKSKSTTITDLRAFMLCLEKHWPQILSVANILTREGFKQGIRTRQLLWKLGIYFLSLITTYYSHELGLRGTIVFAWN